MERKKKREEARLFAGLEEAAAEEEPKVKVGKIEEDSAQPEFIDQINDSDLEAALEDFDESSDLLPGLNERSLE